MMVRNQCIGAIAALKLVIAAKKKREKQEDILAKQRIKDKIAADKEERKLKAEKEKAQREGQALPIPPQGSLTEASRSSGRPASAYTETRLRLQTPQGSLTKSFGVDSTLFDVVLAIKAEQLGFEPSSFMQTFPKKSTIADILPQKLLIV